MVNTHFVMHTIFVSKNYMIHPIQGTRLLEYNLEAQDFPNVKEKNIMWKIYRNCLPTRVRLKDKGVICPISCTLCMMGCDDTLHLFCQCPNNLNVGSMLQFFSSISILLQQDMDNKNIIF